MQLRQPKLVSAVNDDGVGIGDVDAGFNDGRAHQHIGAAMGEIRHHHLQLAGAHLAMADGHPSFGNVFDDVLGRGRDVAHFVVQIKHLSTTGQLPLDGFLNQHPARFADEGFDRQPSRRWCCNDGHVANACHGHIQGAGNRSRGKREHIHVHAQCFELLFVAHTETMFFIDDHKA